MQPFHEVLEIYPLIENYIQEVMPLVDISLVQCPLVTAGIGKMFVPAFGKVVCAREIFLRTHI